MMCRLLTSRDNSCFSMRTERVGSFKLVLFAHRICFYDNTFTKVIQDIYFVMCIPNRFLFLVIDVIF